MSKKFKSLSEVVSFIKQAQTNAIKEIGESVEEIIKETTQDNLYDSYSPNQYIRTGDMMRDMVQTKSMTSNSLTVGFEDNGGHTSWVSPYPHVFVAPILEEGGHTREVGGGRKPPTRIIEDSYEKAEKEVPKVYISAMASQGVKVTRK